VEPETEFVANPESEPEPRTHYQPQYQPEYQPRYSPRASVDEPLAASTAGAESETGETSPLPLAPRSEKNGRQLARPATVGGMGPIGTVVGSLAIVLGLFVAVVWVSRRLGPAGSAPLPKEAVELLGRTTVSGQHSLQLVRFGGRLLLVALSPHGAATLTEIIDPTEVERLTAICLRQRPGSSSESFRQTIRQLEREPAGRSFVDQRRPASSSSASRARPTSRA
jgi:flagellar biogenesis protein FliO